MSLSTAQFLEPAAPRAVMEIEPATPTDNESHSGINPRQRCDAVKAALTVNAPYRATWIGPSNVVGMDVATLIVTSPLES
ncbi:hypothetical protein [Solidesulfovibrio carbinolicus]|uniref:Uncharacterized protein n=1 Tax=Solidesulfovibrio carbinolicus TaxID=296842 RepID=A0A4P6HNP3_9BACT|nr:hypothetical protein [Solidesulfovibrio carbinolicus]QAZ66778.1 hypothetical protein C3Y92_05775 [Solidesulfovibrio carbinolicus]